MTERTLLAWCSSVLWEETQKIELSGACPAAELGELETSSWGDHFLLP
jgi:hypothetical protein